MYLIKAVIHTQHNSGSKKIAYPNVQNCMSHLRPPSAPTHQGRRKTERDVRPSDSHPRQQIFLHSVLSCNVCLRLEIRIRVHHGRERYRSGLGHVSEFQKVEEIHIGPSSYSLLSTKKSKTRKERHTLQAKSTFHPYPSLAPSQSPRS